jgi:hypothetical protein
VIVANFIRLRHTDGYMHKIIMVFLVVVLTMLIGIVGILFFGHNIPDKKRDFTCSYDEVTKTEICP